MEDNLNQNIQSLWIGGQLSAVERLCIQSFLDHGHDFHLYTYEGIHNAPEKAILHDAREIIPENEIFKNTAGWGEGSVSGFADLFRLKLIQTKGGWWVDMDVICLKRFDFNDELILCSSYEDEYGQLANNCVFKAPRNSLFISCCLDELANINLKTMPFGTAGPFLFQKIVKDLYLESHVSNYWNFNPISWKNVKPIILGYMTSKEKVKELLRPYTKPKTMAGRKIPSSAYAVHFWNEVWKAGKLDKNGNYPTQSIFEKLKRKHNIR